MVPQPGYDWPPVVISSRSACNVALAVSQREIRRPRRSISHSGSSSASVAPLRSKRRKSAASTSAARSLAGKILPVLFDLGGHALGLEQLDRLVDAERRQRRVQEAALLAETGPRCRGCRWLA